MDSEVMRKYACSKCSENFPCKSSLQLHLKSHQNEVEQARPCEQTEKKEKNSSSAPPQQQVLCVFNGCKRIYSSAGKMQSHFMKRHPNREQVLADLSVILDEGVPLPPLDQDDGDSSSSSEGEDQRGNGEGNLEQEHQPIASTDRQCAHCGKEFTSRSSLLVHIRVHTGEKPFECTQCASRFSQKGNLDLHMRRHSNERPYSCDKCSAKFAQKGNLATHLRKHTKEKPYECNLCAKKFTQKSNLDAHLRTHSGEKPYFCDICSECFTQSSNLIVHMKKHETDEHASQDINRIRRELSDR